MDEHAVGLGTVVVGVDFTADSEAVIQWVGRRLPPEGTTVLVHAVELPHASGETPAQRDIRHEVTTSAIDSLERMGEKFLTDRNVETVVQEGEPSQVLTSVALECGANLIVVGPHHGRPAFERFVGSTAQRLIHEGAVPVLLAAVGAPSEQPGDAVRP